MPNNVSSDFIAKLDSDVIYMEVFCRIIRNDGYVQGFTSHQYDLSLEEEANPGVFLTYRGGIGMTPSALETVAGNGVSNANIQWFYDNNLLDQNEVRAGLYDDAIVEFFTAFVDDLTLGRLKGPRCEFGTLTTTDNQVADFEVRSRFQRTQEEVGELTSIDCRAVRLGDARCKFDTSGNTADGFPARSTCYVTAVTDRRRFTINFNATTALPADQANLYTWDTIRFTSGVNNTITTPVQNFDGHRFTMQINSNLSDKFKVGDTGVAHAIRVSDLVAVDFNFVLLSARQESSDAFSFIVDPSFWGLPTDDAPGFPSGFFTNGIIEFINGLNKGVKREVMAWDVSGFALQEEAPFDIEIGAVLVAEVGCDRRKVSCHDRFDNVINFVGEPFIKPFEKVSEIDRVNQHNPFLH